MGNTADNNSMDNIKLIKSIASDRGISITTEEAKIADKKVTEELEWEVAIGEIDSVDEEFYYRMKQYFYC